MKAGTIDGRRAAGHRRGLRLCVAAVRGGDLRRPARRAGAVGNRQRLGLCAVDGGVLQRPDLLRMVRSKALFP